MKKGYTITELASVLVVLTIIICITLAAVSPQIKRAKKESFINEANNIKNTAITKYTTEIINDEDLDDLYDHDDEAYDGKVCYNLMDLNNKYIKRLGKDYKGSIEICYASTCKYRTKIWLTNGKFYLNEARDTVIMSDIEKKAKHIEKCGLKD